MTRDEIELLYGWKPGEREAVMEEMAERQAVIDKAKALEAATMSTTVPAAAADYGDEWHSWYQKRFNGSDLRPVQRQAAAPAVTKAAPGDNPLAVAVKITLDRMRREHQAEVAELRRELETLRSRLDAVEKQRTRSRKTEPPAPPL